MIFRLRIDPWITTGEEYVDIEEMKSRHNPADSMSGEGITTVIQDTGLDESHPRIKENVKSVKFKDFTGEGKGDAIGHGTAVTDMATRYADDQDIVVNRVFGNKGSGSFGPFKKSFEWIIDHADELKPAVLNMSWGAKRKVSKIDQYVNTIAKKGIIPVAASGNSGGKTGSPATASHCISVGALQEKGEKMTNFSSWDMDSEPDPGMEGIPEVSAIGKNVLLARAEGTSMGRVIDKENVVASGTSFSSPFTAGTTVDYVRRYYDKLTKALRALEKAATDIPGTARDGLGRVNWKKTVEGEDSPNPPDTATFTAILEKKEDNGKILGHAKLKGTHKPVSGAEATIKGPVEMTKKMDEKGDVSFKDIPAPAKYDWKVTKKGLKHDSGTITKDDWVGG